MNRTRRQGTAPLEFVLVLPLLFTITVAGWWCAGAGLTKTKAATDARRAAWEQRDDAKPGRAFDLRQRPLVSAVESDITADVPRSNPFSSGKIQAKSFDLMTDKVWDHEQFEFPKLATTPMNPHVRQLLHFGMYVPVVLTKGLRTIEFARLDLMINPEFLKYIPKGIQLRVERLTTVPIFAAGAPLIAAAIIKSVALGIAKWPTIPYYAYLISVMVPGIGPSISLVSEALK
jgi:hypothetical protein